MAKLTRKTTRKKSVSKVSPLYRRIGFVVKHHQKEATELAADLAASAVLRGCSVILDKGESRLKSAVMRRITGKYPKAKKCVTQQSKDRMIDLVDLVVVLGGDGTFLGIARRMKKRSIPLLGVNMGTLGFLTEIKKEEAHAVFDTVLSNPRVKMSQRTLLEVCLRRGGKVILNEPIVNDAVVSKGTIARMIGIDVTVNSSPANTVRADGMIISSPTGSTAYSLAAGGPIVEPHISAMIVTPICPHSLTQRPMLLADTSKVELRLRDRPGEVFLTLDGQNAVRLFEGDVITVRKFKRHPLKLISSPTRDYFSLIREKFQFGSRI